MKAELLILGVLHRGNFHPYEIKRRFNAAMLECYTDLDVGTLYYAIRQLAKDGSIEALASERVARGGQRTVYGITASGRKRFQQLLHEQFEAPGFVPQTLYPALLFLHLGDHSRMAGLLEAKIAQQTEALRKMSALRKELAPVLSTGGEHLLKHLEQQRRLDRKWLQALQTDVIEGRVHDVRDPARLAAKTSK